MDIKTIIVDNYVMIYELIGLLIMLRISAHISKYVKKITIIAIILIIAESVVFYLELWTQSFEKLSILRPILTSLEYISYPFILFLIMRVTANDAITKKKMLLLLIPAIIAVPIYFTSQWTHLVFYFTEGNHYQGGFLPDLPYIIFALYAILFLVNNIMYFKKYARVNRFIIIYIILASLLGVVSFVLFAENRDYASIFTSAMILYYLCLYINMARIDSLTGLANRQSYYQDMSHYKGKIKAVVSIDMNELKYINDNFGHEAGDSALKTISNLLWDNCGKNGILYRVGGDEFMIFYFTASKEEVEENIKNMRSSIDNANYSCAFGYAMNEKDKDLEEVILISDQKMYEDKAYIKANLVIDGKEIHFRK